MKIKISNKLVGNNNPVFIIAEGGINHNGKLSLAKKIISKAKAAGADAVKFQTFKAEDLASPKSKFFKIFKKLELDFEEFGELADYAKNQNIIFLSTPFSFDAVNLLIQLKVPAFKIASGDLTNIPLVEYAASKKKPMIISTGMANETEIQQSINAIRKTGNKKIIIMHSVSAYPTPINEVNLSVIKQLREKFKQPVGYSDNGSNLLVPVIAVASGADLIEKHFTINRKLSGPDQKLSTNPSDFKKLVKNIRLVEKMIGVNIKKCQTSEFGNKFAARRSITALTTIERGTKIDKKMLGLQRPASGLEPKYFSRVIGKRAKRKITKGESIKWNQIQ